MGNSKTYDEGALVTALKAGDKQAFAQLYDRFSGALYGLSLKMMGDEAKAQDVLQESFVKAWKNIAKYDATKGRLFTWLSNVTRNMAIDHIRKADRKPTVEIRTEEQRVHVENNNSTELNTDTIGMSDAISKLDVQHREILEYLYFKGYTQQETADELKIPLGSVKTRVRIAVREMRLLFDAEK